MIHLSRVLSIIHTNKPFSLKYVAAGNKKKKRAGGYIVEVKKGAIMSSNYQRRYLNIKLLPSGQIRECKYILIIEFNGQKVFI